MITEFLLARIAEDEAEDARRSHFGDGSVRMRSECAAKRRILKRCRESNGYWGAEIEAMMAAVYADHPDYDESWRS